MTGKKASFVVYIAPEFRERKCGGCTLCCKLVEVRPDKVAGKRCQYQNTGKGCRIYKTRPRHCIDYTCRWLMGEDAKDLPRPDRAHYVIDPMPDYIRLVQPDSAEQTLAVLQIWLDPAYPRAYDTPALKAYLTKMALNGYGALIRLNPNDGFIFLSPIITGQDDWFIQEGIPEARNDDDYLSEMSGGFRITTDNKMEA